MLAMKSRALLVTGAGVPDLARAAVHASYADEDVKNRILGEIDEYAAG